MEAAIITLLGTVIVGMFGFGSTIVLVMRRNNNHDSTFANSIFTQLNNIDIKLVKMSDEIGKVAAGHAAIKQEVTDMRERVDKLEERVESR